MGATLPPVVGAVIVEALWRYADPGFVKFSQEVSADILGDPARVMLRGAAGLVRVEDGADESWTFVQRIAVDDLDEWLDEKRVGVSRDKRLGPSSIDADGVRFHHKGIPFTSQ